LLTGCGETTPTLSECVPHGECAGLSLDNTKAPFTAKDGNAAAGGKLYGKLCASCHGQDGVGVGVANGISLRAPMWHAARTDNQIRLTVLRGKGSRMPAFALSSEELRDVVAFLRTLRDEAVRPSQPTY
jgi:mono/diheme cytochrome c family protein